MEDVLQQRQNADADTKRLVEAFRLLFDHYPASFFYKERASKAQIPHWNEIGKLLREVRHTLKIEIPVMFDEDGRAYFEDDGRRRYLTKAECFVRGITNMYIAEALRYAVGWKDFTGPCSDEVHSLYEEAEQLFVSYSDTMHTSWATYEWANSLLEAGQALEQEAQRRVKRNWFKKVQAVIGGDRNRHLLLFAAAAISELHEHALNYYKRALSKCAEGMEQASINEEADKQLDRELCANFWRIQADVYSSSLYAAQEDTQHQVWGLYALTLLAACGFLVTDQDTYSHAMYREVRERLLDTLEAWIIHQEYDDREEELCRFLADFWVRRFTTDTHMNAVTVLRQLRKTSVQKPNSVSDAEWREAIYALLPPVPRLVSAGRKDLTAPRTQHDVNTEDLQALRAMLMQMPEHVQEWLDRSTPPPAPRPRPSPAPRPQGQARRPTRSPCPPPTPRAARPPWPSPSR